MLVPLLYVPFSISSVTAAGDVYPKIGFSEINGINGASELNEAGYAKAVEMGAQIEHRDYGWAYLNISMNPVYEWKTFYINRFEELEASVSISVISKNFTSLEPLYDFTRYLTTPLPGDTNYTRFNDPKIVESLKNYTDLMLGSLGGFSYISFGSEINGFFETYFDYETNNMTSTAMLDDYVDLCEQLYDYVKTEYSSVKVLTNFRYQIESDALNIAPIIQRFDNCCDIYSMTCRIFTDDFGFMQILTEDEILERFEGFIDLTGTKKFAITNTFTISDSAVGGSDSYQALFVRTLFKLITDYSTKMEFACWYRLYDFPPGYLGMIFNQYLEAQRTSGLLTQNGDQKLAYYTWIKEMQSLGRLPDLFAPWKIAVYTLALVAIAGFLIFTAVMEGMEIFQKDAKQGEEKEKPLEFSTDDTLKLESKKKKQKSPKPGEPIIFTDEEDIEESEESLDADESSEVVEE